jgi:gliding motility-associated-like protein
VFSDFFEIKLNQIFFIKSNNGYLMVLMVNMRRFKQIVILLFFALGGQMAFAQLSVSQANALAMVDYLVDEENGTVEFNPATISFSGGANMLGQFNGSSSNIGFQEGVLMSTGLISNAVGPNDDDGLNGGGNFELSGTNLLAPLIGGKETYDAAVLRFQFRILGDYVKFRYVFASEEYNEFVCSEFNDAFAFFISGPGIAGMENLALVPGTTTPVTINTINNGAVGVNGSSSNSPCILSNSAFFAGNNQNSVQYDGFTRPMTAEKGGLQSCVWYTLTLVIADVNDSQYDSAVFLEAGSLSSNAPQFSAGAVTQINGLPNYSPDVTTMNESCGSLLLTIQVENPLQTSITFPLTIGGTASPGVDYESLPASVTIQAGQTVVNLPITIISDATAEPGGETINISYTQQTCSGPLVTTQTFTILDPPAPLTIEPIAPFDYLCPRIPTLLNGVISGGKPPYFFQWAGFGPQINPVTVIPEQSGSYVFTVTDQCGASTQLTAQININGYVPLVLNAQPEHIICKGDFVSIGAPATGGKPPLSYFWQPVSELSPVIAVSPSESSSYTLSVTDSCSIQTAQNIQVTVNEVVALFDVTYLDQRTIQFIDLSYDDVQLWSWDFGYPEAFSSEQNPMYTFPDTGFFEVELAVSDANNCRDTVKNPIYAYPPYTMFIPNAFTPDGDGINDVFSGIGEGYVNYEMWIYNRWGEQIFYTDSDADGWGSAGRYSLEDLPSGVYAYKIVTRRPTLEKNEYIGKVVVLN